MERLNLRDTETAPDNLLGHNADNLTSPKSTHHAGDEKGDTSGNRRKPSKFSSKKKTAMADTSLLNFHFERPVAVTQTYSSSRHQNPPTVSERRNKARHSLLSKETYLQAK